MTLYARLKAEMIRDPDNPDGPFILGTLQDEIVDFHEADPEYMATLTPTKLSYHRPVVGDQPAFDSRYQSISGPVYTIGETEVTRTWTVTDHDLATVKATYSARVNADAEATRLKYLTPGSGQAMTYQEKFNQAEAVNALGQAAADALTQEEYELAYPVLSASVGIEAASLWDCAQLVIQRYVAFNVLANVIEKTRLQGKKNINDAVDGAGVIAAYEAITWTV